MKRLPTPLYLLFKTNLWRTLIFNYKMFPKHIARKLPVIIIGRVNTKGSTGKIVFSENIHMGMAIVGEMSEELCPYKRAYPMRFMISGLLTLGDHVHIRGGGVFNVYGEMTIGSHSLINSYCRIWCSNRISIGKNSRLSWDCQLFDSNFHYMVDDEGYTKKCQGEVIIGDNVWIGNRVTINKGTVLPNYSIIASNSYINRSFSEYGERAIIGGSPAKYIKSGFRRLFNYKKEAEVNAFFQENTSEDKYYVGQDFDEKPYNR